MTLAYNFLNQADDEIRFPEAAPAWRDRNDSRVTRLEWFPFSLPISLPVRHRDPCARTHEPSTGLLGEAEHRHCPVTPWTGRAHSTHRDQLVRRIVITCSTNRDHARESRRIAASRDLALRRRHQAREKAGPGHRECSHEGPRATVVESQALERVAVLKAVAQGGAQGSFLCASDAVERRDATDVAGVPRGFTGEEFRRSGIVRPRCLPTNSRPNVSHVRLPLLDAGEPSGGIALSRSATGTFCPSAIRYSSIQTVTSRMSALAEWSASRTTRA